MGDPGGADCLFSHKGFRERPPVRLTTRAEKTMSSLNARRLAALTSCSHLIKGNK